MRTSRTRQRFSPRSLGGMTSFSGISGSVTNAQLPDSINKVIDFTASPTINSKQVLTTDSFTGDNNNFTASPTIAAKDILTTDDLVSVFGGAFSDLTGSATSAQLPDTITEVMDFTSSPTINSKQILTGDDLIDGSVSIDWTASPTINSKDILTTDDITAATANGYTINQSGYMTLTGSAAKFYLSSAAGGTDSEGVSEMPIPKNGTITAFYVAVGSNTVNTGDANVVCNLNRVPCATLVIANSAEGTHGSVSLSVSVTTDDLISFWIQTPNQTSGTINSANPTVYIET